MSDYPEHDKLDAVWSKHQNVTNFVEWLESNGYEITVSISLGRVCDTDDLINTHFGLDSDTIRSERKGMLTDIRKAVAQRT